MSCKKQELFTFSEHLGELFTFSEHLGELFTFSEHLGSPPVFLCVRVANLFSFLCYVVFCFACFRPVSCVPSVSILSLMFLLTSIV